MTLVETMNEIARVVTPWQAVEVAQPEGNLTGLEWLMACMAGRHDHHYADAKRRPPNPWTLERDDQVGVTALVYGAKRGHLAAAGFEFDSPAIRALTIMCYTRDDRRGEKDQIVGVHWEFGGVAGTMGTADPVGDTIYLDGRVAGLLLNRQAWLFKILEAIPDLDRVLAESEGVAELRAMRDAWKEAQPVHA